jgi:hypothetical protein
VVWQGEPFKSMLWSNLVDDDAHRVQFQFLLQP